MKPVIGIVICGFENSRQFVSQPYIEAIIQSGGCPILLPCTDDRDLLSRYVHMCDGFLFCGGGDITPFLFDEPPLTSAGTTDIKTDIFHLTFMEYALLSNFPILAICRGMQILNVSLGGTIYQDLSLISTPVYHHMQHSESRSDVSHRVYFKPNSLLYRLFGDYCYTNSYHHQAIHNTGSNTCVTGSTKDGVAEAIEATDHPFAVGVQWHPECMYHTSKEMKSLFDTFIEAASIS